MKKVNTIVVVSVTYDYYRFESVLYAGTPTRVNKWLEKNSSKLPKLRLKAEDSPEFETTRDAVDHLVLMEF